MRPFFALLALAGGIAVARAEPTAPPAPLPVDPAYQAFAEMLTAAQQREFAALRRAVVAERALESARTAPTTPPKEAP